MLLQPPSRLASILNSPGPLTLVVPTLIIPSRALSVATRLARDLDLYHKLDAEIISDSEAEQRLVDGMLGKGNIVFIGLTGEGEFARRVLREGNTPFAMKDNDEPVLTLNGEVVEGPSQGMCLTVYRSIQTHAHSKFVDSDPIPPSTPQSLGSLHSLHVRHRYLRARKSVPSLPNPHRDITPILAHRRPRSRQSRRSRRARCRVKLPHS